MVFDDALNIRLYRERTYHPGDEIMGTVLVPFTTLDRIQSIDVEFAICSWAQLRTTNPDDTPIGTSQKLLFTERKNLWAVKGHGRPITREENGLVFPFEFSIPFDLTTPDNTTMGSTAPEQNMPPTVVKNNGQVSARVDYEITATCAFTDSRTPLLQGYKPLKLKTNTVPRTDLMKFVEMPSSISIILHKEDHSGFFKKTFSKSNTDHLRYQFRVVVVRPEFIRYSHRVFFKVLLLTDTPPSFFPEVKQAEGYVKRGSKFNTGILYLRGIDAYISSFTNVRVDDCDACIYEEEKVISSGMSIQLDPSKLLPFAEVDTLSHIENPTQYALDITSHVPPVSIPHLIPSFQTENIKQVHVLKFKFKFASQQVGSEGVQATECEQVVNIVSPGMEKITSDNRSLRSAGSLYGSLSEKSSAPVTRGGSLSGPASGSTTRGTSISTGSFRGGSYSGPSSAGPSPISGPSSTGPYALTGPSPSGM